MNLGFSGVILMTLSRKLAEMALALVVSLTIFAGCGGTVPEVDNAEVIKTDPPKPGPAPATTPESASPKDTSKG
jgi:hypothetical protein